MKVAVLGANGYLGLHLVKCIRETTGWQVVAFDIHESFKGNSDTVYHKMDITRKADLELLDSDLDQVYFFSGLTGTDVSIDKYEDYIRVNEIGFLNFLDHIKERAKKPKILFPSTRLVYKGSEGVPLPETAAKEFKTIYASSKYNGELYLEMFRNLYNLDYSVFRICVPYGNELGGRQSYGTISFFLERAGNGEPIALYGDGSLKRTFTHVMDICHQIIEAGQMPGSSGECFNIDGETFSLLDIAGMIGNKYSVPVVFKEWPIKALQLESGDTIFEASKIKALIHITLNYSLQAWINS